MGQIGRLADERLGDEIFGKFIAVDEVVAAERAPNSFKRVRPRPLVDRNADPVADLCIFMPLLMNFFSTTRGLDLHRDCVEEVGRPDLEAE